MPMPDQLNHKDPEIVMFENTFDYKDTEEANVSRTFSSTCSYIYHLDRQARKVLVGYTYWMDNININE